MVNVDQLQELHTFVLQQMTKQSDRINRMRNGGPRAIPEFNQAIGAKFAYTEMRHLLERSFPDVDWES